MTRWTQHLFLVGEEEGAFGELDQGQDLRHLTQPRQCHWLSSAWKPQRREANMSLQPRSILPCFHIPWSQSAVKQNKYSGLVLTEVLELVRLNRTQLALMLTWSSSSRDLQLHYRDRGGPLSRPRRWTGLDCCAHLSPAHQNYLHQTSPLPHHYHRGQDPLAWMTAPDSQPHQSPPLLSGPFSLEQSPWHL